MNTAAETTRLLNEVESKQLLESAGVRTATARLARSDAEAVQIATELGFPAVLKIVSDDVAHKSDIGGVRLGLESAEDAERAYGEIMKAVTDRQPNARIDGVSVQRMAAPGLEVIIGMSRDPQFGPVMMFGLGGVLVEVLEDVVFRLVPLERRDAVEMLQEIKGSALLDGYRGAPPVDRDALVDLLLQVSAFIDAHPEISELDLNPVFAYPDGAIAVDARIVIAS